MLYFNFELMQELFLPRIFNNFRAAFYYDNEGNERIIVIIMFNEILTLREFFNSDFLIERK